MPGRRLVLLLGLTALWLPAARAEVQTATSAGFVLTQEITLAADAARVFRALAEVSEWWDPAHTYSGEADNLSLELRAGGCFCEALADGGSVEHMRILFAAPGKLLRLGGGLGPLQGMGASGVLDFALEGERQGATRLRLRYTVGGFAADGLAAMAAPVDQVLAVQLERLAGYLTAQP